MTTPLSFVSVGFDHAVCANRVVAVLQSQTAPARRRLKLAKEGEHYLDMTLGRALKCLLLLDDGCIVGCAVSSRTMTARLQASGAGEALPDMPIRQKPEEAAIAAGH